MLPPSPTIDRCKTGVLMPLAFLAGTKLDIFTALAAGPRSAEELATSMSIASDWMRPLLFALAASGLLVHDNGTFRNSDESDHFLVRGRPHFIGDIGSLFEDMWRGAFLAAESVKAGKPMAAHDYAAMSDEAVSAFFAGQHPDALLTGWKLADAVDFADVRNLVDIGGGSGGISIALCEHFRHLHSTVVDLPAVADVATGYLTRSDARDRLEAFQADLLAAPLPGNYDAGVMRSLLQVFGPGDCELVLRNIRPALIPGATLYVIGQIVDSDRLRPENVALFNLVFMSFYEEGRAHSEEEYKGWLEAAGFVSVSRQITTNGLNMMTARVPG